ncbi:MAG: OmpA family protein [Bacteroidetes bacterium]|nr:OmpA family protein [Bacteroidota bacterium]
MNKISGLFLVVIGFSALLSGCLSKLGKADENFQQNYWTTSIEQYKEEIPKTKDKAEAARKTYNLAYSYYMVKDYKQAITWFENAEAAKYGEAHPELLYYLAEAYKANCEYEKSLARFNQYKERVPGDKRALNSIKSIELAQEWQKSPTRYKVENVVQLNSPNDDANVAYSSKDNKEIIFYSYRDGATGKEQSDILGQDFPDLYAASLDKKGKWSTPALLGKEVNSEFTEGAPIMDAKYQTLYFSRCGGENQKSGCQIYMAKKNGADFGPAIVIPIAADSLAVAHPALSPDDKTLYFASNMSGGFGGKDIWYVTYNKKDNVWEKPTNLGPEVNTPGDELFPYVHADGTLYFSSNGHIGIGGFDLFKAAKTQDGFGPVINLKVPLNSCADDLSITFEDKAERGYITSNREGGKGKYDIWSFVLPKLEFTMHGKAINDSNEIVPGATIYLVGSDGSQVEAKADQNGDFKFNLLPNVSYTLNGASDDKWGPEKFNRKKYLSSPSYEFTTVGVDESKDFQQDVKLPFVPIKLELPNIVYPYNSADLTPETKVILNTFIKETLIPNPTMSIEMGSHTDCRGGADYNRKLAQRRAESAVKYLIEKGVDPSRLKAKGYGEDVPKEITKDNFKFVPKGYEATFPIGTVLTEAYINKLSKELQEVAHQMNRRTEFKFLCTDWAPGKAADACIK